MKRKKIISLFMAVVMLLSFSVSAFAAEVDTSMVNFGEIEMIPCEFNEGISPRMPGTAGLYSVLAAPALVATGQYTTNYTVTNNSGNGRTSYLHVTLDDRTRQFYDENQATGYYVEVGLNLTGVKRYELLLNGKLVKSESCAGMQSGTLRFIIADERPAIWQVNLYDNTTTAKMTWGHINYR